ncbi:MAG: aminomethyl-transferring glycine dehydrogenase subunit GcvPA [Candidatus Bipolaricaulaceae bacterium]
MSEYIPHTPQDIAAMLREAGVGKLDELFADLPAELKQRFRPLELPPRDELWVRSHLAGLAERSRGSQLIPFLGGGLYDHHVPAVVDYVISQPELYTAYTPYQAELSQGTLTWTFEYQTMVCELTGMEVANASMYDGATALAEAVLMAHRTIGGRRVLVPRSLDPRARRVLATYAWGAGLELVDVPYGDDGRLALAGIPEGLSALVVQQPNFFGVIEHLAGLKERIGRAFLIVHANPIALGVLEPPGRFGADVVVGEGQPLGNRPSFGGPLLGLFATRAEHLRRMPGRVVGWTTDAAGRPGYVMALQTREQHIRRERATSNICTNSALCALAATVYLAALGPAGLREVALACLERAHQLADAVSALPGYELAFSGPFFHEFAVRCADPAGAVERLRRRNIAVLPPAHVAPTGLADAFLVAVTERRTQEELDAFVDALQEEGG